jgi:hypothetical protein
MKLKLPKGHMYKYGIPYVLRITFDLISSIVHEPIAEGRSNAIGICDAR